MCADSRLTTVTSSSRAPESTTPTADSSMLPRMPEPFPNSTSRSAGGSRQRPFASRCVPALSHGCADAIAGINAVTTSAGTPTMATR